MAGLIGALRVSLSADTAAFSSGMKGAERQAAKSGSAIQRSLSGIKAGIAGIVAGISIGQITSVISKALDYAASLGEVSQQLGVTTRDLQVYRYAATQVGISQEEMDKGLAKLTLTLGQVAAGAKGPIAAFKAIGISVQDLKNADAGQAMRMIADGLERLPDPAQRSAVGAALMGRNFQKMLPLLNGGRAGIDGLADAADRLGIVLSDEQIRKADETADKLAAVKMVLEARIAGVVADNASSILDLANAMATLVVWAGKVVTAMSAVHQMGVRAGQSKIGQFIKGDGILELFKGDKPAPVGRRAINRGNMKAPVKTGSVGKFLAGGGRANRGPRGKSAEQIEKERLRAIEEAAENLRRFTDDEARANADVVRATAELAGTRTAMLEAELLQIEVEREANKRDITANEDLNQAQKDRLLFLNEENSDTRKAIAVNRDYLESQDELFQLADARLSNNVELLRLDAAAATTAAEQRAAELRVLDATIEQERARLENIKALHKSTDLEFQQADIQLQALAARRAGAEAGIRRETMGPMESYMSSLPRTAAEANEAMEALAANGIASIVDGLTDAATGAKSLGDVFKNVAKQIIADLIRIQIQKAIVGALSSAMNALGGGSGFGDSGSSFQGPAEFSGSSDFSGILSSISSVIGSGGRALGGPVLPGRTYRVGEHGPEFLTMGAKGHVTPDNDNGPSRWMVVPSPYFDLVVDNRATRVAAPMAQSAAMAGSSDAQSTLARRQARAIP